MAETIRLPGIGEVKRTYVWGAVALVAGIVGYAWWRAGSGSGGPATADEGAFLGEGVDDGSAWPYRPGGSSTVDVEPVDPDTLPPQSNDEWARRATDRLVDVGWDPLQVATVLGKYLDRRPLTPPEQDLVRAAFALVGMPPVDPPPIVAAPATPSPTPAPAGLPAPTGLRVTSRTRTSITAKWSAVAGASRYQLDIVGPAPRFPSTIRQGTQATIRNLKPGTRYSIRVRAGKGDTWGSFSGDVATTTQK